jgi:hypothetical protein
VSPKCSSLNYDVLNPVAELKDIAARRKSFDMNRIDIMQRENKYPYPLLDESTKMFPVRRFPKLIRKWR